MTSDQDDHDDHDDHDDTSEGSTERPTGLLGQLWAVIDAFSEIETNEGGHRRESGHIERGNTSIEYNYEVSIGLGPTTEPDPPRPRSPTESIRDPEDDSPALHVETRDIGETERVVIADLPETTEEELDVRFDAEQDVFELWIGEECVESVTFGIRDITIADVTFNNQILKVRLERTGDANDGESNE